MYSVIRFLNSHTNSSQLLYIIEGKNPRGVAVTPNRLNCVTADLRDPPQLKRLRRQRLVRTFVKNAHDIPLSFAPRTWAVAPHRLQSQKALAAVVPFDGQFLANLLNVHW